ncbi:MAG: YggS family pyridoxal phosphate-dependent enzyme [Ruminococcaceae bacterium]|nr:YggS family pyridoxal phosphate-dependent enzyme [Oscillospiraceae bacterium]
MTEKLCNPDATELHDNIARVRERIENACVRAGRCSDEVTLLAVTKTVSVERINAAIADGITEIGENRVQEYLQKRDALLPVKAHLIGHLQTNKAAQIAHRVAMVQSVDSLRVAEALNSAAEKHGITLDILAQVNIGGEESKSGVAPVEAAEFCAALREFSALNLRGMMTIPPISDTEYKKREYFSRMSQLFIDIRTKNVDNSSMDILSMGMSDDYEEAVLEGSTMVRVGSAIFGKRNY